jgi:hypothetical protein
MYVFLSYVYLSVSWLFGDAVLVCFYCLPAQNYETTFYFVI